MYGSYRLFCTGFSPGVRVHSSPSIETTHSVSLDLNDYSPAVSPFLAGTRNTSQGEDPELLSHIQGSGQGIVLHVDSCVRVFYFVYARLGSHLHIVPRMYR